MCTYVNSVVKCMRFLWSVLYGDPLTIIWRETWPSHDRLSPCSALVRHGVLLPRDVGKNKSWWFGIPGVSPFIKSLIKGRSAVQQMLKRSKFNELLQSELETRKFSASKLSMIYHIHDLVGSDLLER